MSATAAGGVQQPSAKKPSWGTPVASAAPQTAHHQSYWLWVLCLTGVDYFSTLGYQPSIAFSATGRLAPFATFVLVLVTLLGAVPVYSNVAAKSARGRGSIAMLERLLTGWDAKLLVLVLLGFAATDFIITMTLSAADAAEHLIHNPLWKRAPVQLHSQMVITLGLLVLLGTTFMRGFREVIGIAVAIVAVYLVLNAIIIGVGLFRLAEHPTLVTDWYNQVRSGDWSMSEADVQAPSWGLIAFMCLKLFPRLALGLSGFETGVAVMPLVRGNDADNPDNPTGRIRNTRKLLLTAALIMSVMLMGSSIVTTMLIPAEELHTGGKAANRALAFLAHGQGPHYLAPIFGEIFGTLYDAATVAILWFAGASALSGLLNLVPRYLPRYGMAPEWATATRPLVLILTAIALFVTFVFKADVNAQGGAYATGVMVLILSASCAVVIDKYRSNEGPKWRRIPWHYVLITAVFIYTAADIIYSKPDGVTIASCFIAAILVLSAVSRIMRSTELERFRKFEFVSPESKFLWESLQHLEIPVLVPHRPGGRILAAKEDEIRNWHHLSANTPIVFMEVEIGDASEFYQSPLMEIVHEEGRFIIRVTRCASIAHVIAVIALTLSQFGHPPELHFGWSDESPVRTNFRFLLFGEGNVPWIVRQLLIKAQPDPALRPRVIIG
jgi:hypothetical protein